MKTLTDIQNELKAILPQGIDLTFQALKNILSEGTDKFNDLLLLESRYMEISRQLLQGVISNDDAQIDFNKVRKDLLLFIDSLQESQLKTAAAEPGGDDDRPDVYNGEVLYRIPKTMKKEEEVKCLVRLAFDRKVLVENLEVQEEDVLKDIRISDVMGVELIDPTDGSAFAIRTINDAVQFVEKDLYTEWLFYVKPLLEGTHPLVLKISVIEIRNGVERKRNVVLEETIEIVATVPVKAGAAAGFVNSGYTVQFSHQTGQNITTEGAKETESAPPSYPAAPNPSPIQPSTLIDMPAAPVKSRPFRKIASAMAALAVLLTASWAVWMSLNPTAGPVIPGLVSDDEKEWKDMKEEPSREALEEYVIKYPGSEYAEIAQDKLDSLENTAWQSALAANDIESLQTYLDAYPNGVHASRAMDMIIGIEEDLAAIEEEQNRQDIRPANPSSSGGNRPTTTTRPKKKNKPVVVPPKQEQTAEPVKEDTDDTAAETPIPMKSASRLPVYPGCEKSNKEKEERCTNEKIGKFISRKLSYPEEARKQQIEGTIEVHFVVEKDGSITNVTSVNDIGGGCAKEAVRLVKELPRFIPGQNRVGEPARIRYKLPIRFKLR